MNIAMKRVYIRPATEIIGVETAPMLTQSPDDITKTLTMPIVETIIITSDSDIQ